MVSTVKWFQLLLSNTNNSDQYKSFAYSEVVPSITIQHHSFAHSQMFPSIPMFYQ